MDKQIENARKDEKKNKAFISGGKTAHYAISGRMRERRPHGGHLETLNIKQKDFPLCVCLILSLSLPFCIHHGGTSLHKQKKSFHVLVYICYKIS